MAYRKQTWRDYDDTKTEAVNMDRGAVVTPERMNHIETGIANSADKDEVTTQLAQTNAEVKKVDLDLIRQASVYNKDKLKNWHLKRAKQMKGENSILNIALWSDSIGEGYSASSPLTREAQKNKSYAGLLHNHFRDTIGDIGVGWLPGYPSNVNLREWRQTGTWTTTNQGVGNGSMRSIVAGSAAELDFDGTGITIVFSNKTFAATCDIFIDGIFKQSYNTNLPSGTPSVAGVVSLTGLSSGNHTLRIVQTKGTQYLDIVGAFPIKGTRGVRVLNHSFSGDTTSRLSTNTENSIKMLSPDLIIFGYHTNDAARIAPETYRDRLSNYVDIALAEGMDVILLAQGAKSNMTTYNAPVAYRDIMREVAGEKGVCMIDWVNRWRMGNELPNLASHLRDLDHPNEKGHKDLFELIIYALEG